MTASIVSYNGFKKIKEIKIYVGASVMMSFAIRDLFVGKAEMALFGMVWLLRVKAEMRRCAKCKREELLKLQNEREELRSQKPIRQHQQETRPQTLHRSVEQQTEGAAALVQPELSQDCISLPMTQTAFYTSDPSEFEGTFCEIHGYIPPKEGNFLFLLFFP